jgi:hypothetical protein
MQSKASPLLIVGSMAFDDLELPTISAKNVVGGSATYSAYAASVFAPVRLVAVVGEDFPISRRCRGAMSTWPGSSAQRAKPSAGRAATTPT